jgi:hypothetical protein
VQLHGASITLSNSQFSSGLAVVVDFESGGSGAVNL